MSDLMNGEIPVDFKNNPYSRVQWEDDLVDPITEEILEEGTTFWADYANNHEWGIWNAYKFMSEMYRQLQRVIVQQELDGRAPGNSGAFADTFDGNPNKLVAQTTSATLTAPRASGTTVLNVDGTEGFEAFTQVTIYDGTNSEDVLITNVTASTITVQPLVNDYVKGAVIARSNAVVTDGQLFGGSWGTYDISLVEVV